MSVQKRNMLLRQSTLRKIDHARIKLKLMQPSLDRTAGYDVCGAGDKVNRSATVSSFLMLTERASFH
jgi:hypothetical protein